jgi:hypothetical protein
MQITHNRSQMVKQDLRQKKFLSSTQLFDLLVTVARNFAVPQALRTS